MEKTDPSNLDRWRLDPVAFIQENLFDPQTGEPFELYKEQIAFLRKAFELTSEGKMRFTEQLFSAPKKSGKTALAALMAIFVATVLAGMGGELYCLANDREQAESRVFRAIGDILRASPRLRDSVSIGQRVINFLATNTMIKSVANDYSGFSGANPTMNVYDESCYFVGENSKRLWDEGIASPARKISFRLSVSTAGFEGESSPLRDLYDRAMTKGRKLGGDLRADGKFLCYWATKCRAPWQSKAWIEEQRKTFEARPHQFSRLIENAWVAAIDQFIPLDAWDRCVDPSYAPVLADPRLPIWVGLDASVSRDSSAIVAVTWDAALKKVRLVRHKVFVPTKANPIDFENQIEAEILDLKNCFSLRKVSFDPFQMISASQRLVKLGVPMAELTQTSGNLTAAGSTLLEIVKFGNLVLYKDAGMRDAVSKCVAKESSRGWKISKTVASHKIDSVVALSFACLDAALGGQQQTVGNYNLMQLNKAASSVRAGVPVATAAAEVGLAPDEIQRWIDRERNAPQRLATTLRRPDPREIEAWEHAAKAVARGETITVAIEETKKVHRVTLDPAALAGYIARANRPLGPSRPRYAPPGSNSPV